ncbi:hypothetical protein CLV30_12872 [Haloactinopolyspora alba]|uniref:Uncharacterized protein n=1 Tax=Haloactinopolyspora alba TaxID=648780 RepID=A0A2P8DF35_9ACTN|nr:hypothetical protein [Haloactinopolyspora alba]PSK95820.1 hypothetical protein CLV30_12872 [Haloactinopolyspora alba]
MTAEQQTPRQRAEALAAAGLLPPDPEELPPERSDRTCHACGTRMDPLLVELGETLHPCCEPPRRRVRRRR